MPAARASEHLADARILVVDDERANTMLLERILQRGGYTNVRSTTDPTTVLAIIGEFRPDLLLLDLKMPHVDGFEILERLARSKHMQLPVLVLTADATTTAKERALVAGARDVLTKPLDLEQVLVRTANALDGAA
jgi:putative two-component system response regulator